MTNLKARPIDLKKLQAFQDYQAYTARQSRTIRWQGWALIVAFAAMLTLVMVGS